MGADRRPGIRQWRGASQSQEGTEVPLIVNQIERLAKRIQEVASINTAYGPAQRQLRQYDLAAFCYAQCKTMAMTAYFLGAKKAGFKPYCNDVHFWLERDGEILDPSAPQFTVRQKKIAYRDKRRAYFTRPSKRVSEMMRRVKAQAK